MMRYSLKHILGIILAVLYGSLLVWRLSNRTQSGHDDVNDHKPDDSTTSAASIALSQEEKTTKQNVVVQATNSDYMVPVDFGSDYWPIPRVPVRLQTAAWDDKRLIEHIRKYWIIPPYQRKYVTATRHRSQARQSEIVDDLFKQKNNGFFVECGAADGIQLSDTIFFEESRNWTGLLIEADPRLFFGLLRNKRHSYMTNACLSPTDKAVVLKYTLINGTLLSGLTDYMEPSHQNRAIAHGQDFVTTQCFPLASILRAIDIFKVHYMSLDVEGSELNILKSIPFESVSIEVMSVEYRVIGDPEASRKKLIQIKDFLIGKHNYKNVQTTESLDIILRKTF